MAKTDVRRFRVLRFDMETQGELAKRRRLLGLSQEDLAERLEVNRSTVYRWERGDSSRPYPRLLDRLANELQVTPQQLDRLLANVPILAESDVDGGPIRLLNLDLGLQSAELGDDAARVWPDSVLALLDQMSAVDNHSGPAAVLSTIESQQPRVEQMLADHRRSTDALYSASRYAEFRGWLYHDMGRLQLAMQWTNIALELATEAAAVDLSAYHWMRKSIASDAGRPQLALSYAESSRAQIDMLPSRMKAVVLRQEAHAHSLSGDNSACDARLDEAFNQVSNKHDDGDLAVYCSPSYVEMEAANAWLELDRFEEATPILEAADAAWSADFARDHGLCKSRLALAYASTENPAEALAAAKGALSIVRSTSSARTAHFLERTQAQLRRVRATDEAAELEHELRLAS